LWQSVLLMEETGVPGDNYIRVEWLKGFSYSVEFFLFFMRLLPFSNCRGTLFLFFPPHWMYENLFFSHLCYKHKWTEYLVNVVHSAGALWLLSDNTYLVWHMSEIEPFKIVKDLHHVGWHHIQYTNEPYPPPLVKCNILGDDTIYIWIKQI
jgi:hypothetical protein